MYVHVYCSRSMLKRTRCQKLASFCCCTHGSFSLGFIVRSLVSQWKLNLWTSYSLNVAVFIYWLDFGGSMTRPGLAGECWGSPSGQWLFGRGTFSTSRRVGYSKLPFGPQKTVSTRYPTRRHSKAISGLSVLGFSSYWLSLCYGSVCSAVLFSVMDRSVSVFVSSLCFGSCRLFLPCFVCLVLLCL